MMFVVVRNMKSQQPKSGMDYQLSKGDIIKLGRLKFAIKDFRTRTAQANIDNKEGAGSSPIKQPYRSNVDESVNEVDPDSENEFAEEEEVEIDCGFVKNAEEENIQCKICWDNNQTVENPLLNSCKCDGSVRYIHYACLKHWLKQKMAKKEESNHISYTWKQFECEICKKPYPYVFKSQGKRYRMVDIELPTDQRKFLWLESLTFEKNSSRMVHIIFPDEDHTEFKLGRGHESNLRVSDISVSRCHAMIKY